MRNSSLELIERAAACEKLAASVKTEIERQELLRRAESLRSLATSEDWLAGRGDSEIGAVRQNGAISSAAE